MLSGSRCVNSHICESRLLCRNQGGGHCPCSLPAERGSFSEPGPTQRVVKDGVERAALGEWRQNRREMSPPKRHYREQSCSYCCVSFPATPLLRDNSSQPRSSAMGWKPQLQRRAGRREEQGSEAGCRKLWPSLDPRWARRTALPSAGGPWRGLCLPWF